MTGTVGDTSWQSVRLYQTSGPAPTILLSIGTGLLSAFLMHLVAEAVARNHKTREGQAFEQFFGEGALSRQERGHIVIQADQIESLLKDLLSDQPQVEESVLRALGSPRKNRLYKARHWVNARDAAGAKTLREGFRQQGFPTPELHIVDHQAGDPFEAHKRAPYVISMGLAFNDATRQVALAIDPHEKHFGIRKDTPKGDAVIMRRGLMGHHFDAFLELVQIDGDKGPRYLFPLDWDIKDWLPSQPTSFDYGLIVRYTAPATVGRRRQTRFVLAGFTEDGTLAAGRYLVDRWERLLNLSKERGRARAGDKTGSGDFVAVVAGPAGSNATWTDYPFVFEMLPIEEHAGGAVA
jgi:hypothetical protein